MVTLVLSEQTHHGELVLWIARVASCRNRSEGPRENAHLQAASWSWRRWLNGCLEHAPARHGVDVSHSAPIAVQERRIDIEREGIIFETIHSEMK